MKTNSLTQLNEWLKSQKQTARAVRSMNESVYNSV